MLAPLCAAWREELLRREEDANSKVWSNCASLRLLTQRSSACCLLVQAQVCLRAHPRTQVPVSIFLPGKPAATPLNSCLGDGPLASGQLLQQEASPFAATAGSSPIPRFLSSPPPFLHPSPPPSSAPHRTHATAGVISSTAGVITSHSLCAFWKVWHYHTRRQASACLGPKKVTKEGLKEIF